MSWHLEYTWRVFLKAQYTIGIVYDGSSGRIGIPASSPPHRTDSFHWTASMTKVLTAVCVLQLVEKGFIGLHDDIRPHVPKLAACQLLKGFDDKEQPILEDNTHPITLW